MAEHRPIPVANSSWVKTIHYSGGLLTLTTKQGKEIHCFGVPASVWEQLQASSSKGEFFNKHIKGKYREA